MGGAGQGDTCHVTCQASDNKEMDGALTDHLRGCECGQDKSWLLLINVDQKYEKRNISTIEMESMFVCRVWCRVTFWSPEYFDCLAWY